MRNKFIVRCVVIATILLIGVVGYTARQEYFPSVKVDSLTATTSTLGTVTGTTSTITNQTVTNGIITNLTATNGIIYELVSTVYGKLKGVYYASAATSVTSHSDASQVGSMAWCISQLAGAGGTVVLPPRASIYTTNSNYTTPSNVSIVLPKGAILAPALGTTLTITTGQWGLYQVFSGSGLVSLSTHFSSVNPIIFGADPTGATDSTTAIQNAANCAAASKLNIVNSAGKFLVSRIYLYYDPVLNPNWPSNIQYQGRFEFSGTGQLNEFDDDVDSLTRTVFYSTNANPVINVSWNTTRRNNMWTLEKFTVVCDNATSCVEVTSGADGAYMNQVSVFQRGTGNGILWDGIWNARLDQVLAHKTDEDQTGTGIWLRSTVTDGQLINLNRCRSRGFENGIRFGAESYYFPTGTTNAVSKEIGGVTAIGCGVVLAKNGIVIGANAVGVQLINCQVEDKSDDRSTEYGVRAGGSSQRLVINGGHYNGTKAAIGLGYGYATSGVESAIVDVEITNSELFLYANDAKCVDINNPTGISLGRIRIEGNRFYTNGFVYTGVYGVYVNREISGRLGVNYYTGVDYAHQINNPYLLTEVYDDYGMRLQRWSYDGSSTASTIEVARNTLPSAGERTWRIGDRIRINTGNGASIKRYVCVSAGDPGTWAGEGVGYGTAVGLPTLAQEDKGFLYTLTGTPDLLWWNGTAWKKVTVGAYP